MDFNQILLFTSLGLLVLVMLFALWGFLAGLKRELKCTVVFLVLLVLAWLVFGNSGILLNLSGGLVDTLRSALNLPEADATIWETIIDFLESMDGLNLEPLLVEGKETYNLIYNIASAVVSFVLLMGATLVVVIITPIIRLITHIVGLIIQGVKKKKTDNQSDNGPVEDAEDPEADDVVLVLEGDEKTGNAVVTLSENKLPPKQKTKQRIWGAVTGALKCVFLLIVLFAPLSGIYSIVKNVSPSTRDLISDLVTGEESGKTNTSESTGPTDVVFDFIDAYGESGIGKFVEGSGYFFGNSFSTLLFDSMANITTEKQHIKIREELIVYIKAVNELNGNLDLGTWSNEEIARLLDTLKDSKLLPEIMPVLIEYASEVPTVKEALAKAVQESAFLTLRDVDWDKDIEKVLDALKHVYALDLFPLEDLNVLTLDAKKIENALSILGETEFVNKLFPIIFKTAVKLDAVEELIGVYTGNLPVDEINWQKELVALAKIYATFQEYGYTDLEQITNANLEELASHLVVEKYATTVSVLEQLVDMAIFTKVVIPVGQSGLNHFLGSEDSEFKDFNNIIKLTSLTVDDWKEDFTSLVEIGKLAVEELNAVSLDIKQMDITSDDAILAMQTIVEKVLTLNVLGDDQTKNDLLMAVFKKFELFNEEDLYYVEYGTNNRVSVLDKVNWQDVENNIGEITTIKNIIACFGRFANLESVDIANFEFDIDALLDDEDVVDIFVDVLEELVDSELVMQLLNPAVNKYVLPITDNYDDDHLIKDIINEIGPGTAVEEIAKILSAFRSAQNLGLFKVSSQGLSALEYQKEDDIHNIINTIFDSKLFEGYEGRIIRIILKATKLLDVEKGLLNDLDYTNEQDILNGFIYILNGRDLDDPTNDEKQTIGIFNDPNFKLTDEEGNLYIDLEYLLQPEKFDLLMSGLELILGTFERDENQEFVEQDGSNLITTLLPNIYQSYIKDLVPDDFVELVDLLGIENLTGEQLARDIRRIVYIARQLVEMDVQTLFLGEPIKYTDKLDNLYNIVDALLDIEMIKPNDSAIFAWVINYVGKLLENTIVIEEVTPEQFEDIDWYIEGSIAKEVITDVVTFLEKNDLTSTDELLEFINNADYLTTDFVTDANADALIGILQKLVELKTLECLSPIFFQALVNRLVENEFIVDFWEGELTGKALMDDLKSILDIALIAVDKIGFVELWRDDFEGNIAIPNAKYVNQIIAKLFNLNLIKGYENKLIEFALNKFIPEDFPIDIRNINLSSVDDWDNEVVVIQTLVTNALSFLENNGFILISDILNFDFADTDALLDFVNAENTNCVANIVESLSTSKLVGRFLEPVLAYAIDEFVTPTGYDFFFLKDVKDAELLQDLKRVATILRAVADHSSVYDLIYLETTEFENVELTEVIAVLKTALVEVGNFNLLNKHSSELLAEVCNELLIQFGINDLYVLSDDFEGVSVSNDFVVLTQIIDILNVILEDNDVTTVGEVIAFKDEIIEDFTVLIENNNVLNLAQILEKLAEMGIVKSILPVAVEYGVSVAEENNFDISFVKDIDLTGEELGNDILCIAKIIVDLVELHAIELYRDEIVHEFDKDVIVDVVEQLANINLFNKAKGDWAAFVVNYVLDALNVEFDEEYTADSFATVNWQQDKEYIQSGLVDLVKAVEILFNETSGGISVYSVTNFIEYQEYLDEGVFTENVVINLFNGLGKIVSVDVLDVVLPEAIRYGLITLADAHLEILDNITIDLTNFAIDEVDLSDLTAKELGEFITSLGAVVNAAIDFGAVEYINTQNISSLQFAKLNPALVTLGNAPFVIKRINGILSLITNIVSNSLNLDVRAEAADFGVVNIQDDVTKLCEVLTNVDITLETLELESLQEVIDFVGNIQLDELLARENIEETISALVNTLRPLFEIEVVQTVLPKITNCLLGLVSEPYNLEFLRNAINNGKITGGELADDVSTILDIVDLAIELDAIDIYNYFAFDEEDVEIKFDIIVTIIDKIESLNILKVDYNNWALFISSLFDASIELSEFDYMTDELWVDDFETLKEIVRNVADLLKANDLLTINSIVEFIENETYITYKAQYLRDENAYIILDIVEEVANINMLNPILTEIVESALTNYVESGNAIIDVEFVLNAISEEQYVGKDMKEDVKDIVNIARDLVAFGALDYYCFGEIEEIDTDILAKAVEKLETLKLYGISKEKWLIVGINELYKLLEIETINTINSAYVEGQFTSIAKVIKDLGLVLDYLDIVSTNDLMEMIENKEYLDSKYYTDVTLNSIIDVLEDVSNIPVLNVIALSLASWGIQSANIDGLEFLEDALEKGCENEKYATYSFGENSPLTSIDLVTDLKSIVSILRNAVDFGIADILYNIRIDEINSEYLENIVRLIANLNVYSKLRSEWLNYGLGLALELIDVTVNSNDFYGIKSDEEAFVVLVKELCVLAENLDIRCLSDLTSFFENKDYLEKDILVPALPSVETILTTLVSTNIVNAIYDKLLARAVELVEVVDISFIEGEYTNSLLVEDIPTLIKIVEIACDFGVLEIIKTNEINEIELEYVVSMLEEFDTLNIYNIARPEWLALALNEVYKALGIEDEVSVADFEGLDTTKEIQTLIEVVKDLDVLMDDYDLYTYTDIEYFIKDKEYLEQANMTDVIVDHIIDVVEDMANLAVVEVSLPTFVSYALDKVNLDGIDFFKEAVEDGEFTHEELVADIKVLVDILRNAVQFGILDVINDVRLEELNSSYLENIVSDVVKLNVYNKLRSSWISYGLGKVLSKIDVTVEASEFEGIDSDEVAVKKAVKALCNLAEQLNIRCKSDLTAFIENKEYYTEAVYTDENLRELEVVLTNLVGTNIVNAIYDKLLARAIELVEVVDISFIEGEYTNSLLAEDIHSILVIVKNLVEFGLFEYRETKTIEEVDMTYIKNVISELENLNMYTLFRAEWVVKVLSRITPKLGFDVTTEDFEQITEEEWKQDNKALQNIIMAVNDLIDELYNPSLTTLIDYYKNFEIERDTLTTDSCLDIYETILLEGTTLNVVNVIFPNVLVYVIEKLANYGLDVEFLNGQLTLAHVHEDIDSLVVIAKSLRDFGIFEIYYKNTSNLVIDVTILNDVIVEAGSLESYSIDRASWIAAIINCVMNKASVNVHMEASDFSNIDWQSENQLLQNIVTAINALLVNAELREYDEIVTTVKDALNRIYSEDYLEIAILEDVLDVMDAAVESQIVQVMIPLVVDKLMNKVVSKGYDVAFVLDTVSDQELIDDVRVTLDALRDLVKFNIVKIWLRGENIDYQEMTLVYSAINKLSGLNIVTGNENELVKVVFEKHGVNTDCLNNGVINASDEAATLIEVLKVLVNVFKSYDLYTKDEVLHYNYKDIRFDDNTDSNLDAIADILEIISNDNMFEIVVFALSERFVGDKYNGILDIHNIYSQYSQLYSDMVSMVEVIRILADLHIVEIKNGTIDYPFNERNNIETIIRNISSLNYFNLPGRMSDIVNKLDEKFPNNGIGDINGDNINLAADADKFVEMYESFANVTDHPDFPILNRSDFNNDMSFGFLKDKEVLKEIANIVNTYMDTTVYDETGPVVLIVLLPIVKKVLPEYWTALDLDNYTVEKANKDMPLFNNIVETIKALGIRDIINGEVDFDGLDESINSIITDLTKLELLNGHVNDLTKVVLKDFVYGKEFFGFVINEDTFDIENVEFDHDAQILKAIITKAFAIMKSENITSLSEAKSYVSNFSVSTFLKNEEAVKYVADILELVAGTSFAKLNAKQMYEVFALPKFDSMNKTQYVDYRNATNEEIIADLIIGADIIRNASKLGLGEVMTGGVINYDQADTVQEILKLVGQLNVVRYSTDAYINYLSRKFKGLETYKASYDTLDVAHELELLGLAYAEVAKALDSDFAYRTLAELKEMTFSGLVEFAQNNGSAVINAVDYLAQMNVVPYLLPTAVELFNSKTQGTILSDVFATVNPYELTLSELSHDVDILVDLLHNILDSDILSYVLNKSGEILSADTATSIVNNIMDMYLLKGQYAAILTQLFANVGVDVSGHNLESIDYEFETEILSKIISEILLAVDEYGLTRYEEIRPELANYKSILVNEGKVAFIKAVRDALVVINAEHIMNVIELVDESELVDRAIIPVYNKVLNKYVPEKYRTYLSIEGYTTDDVAYDTHLLTLAIRSLYDSEIYKLYTTHEHVGRECVPYVQDAIRYLAQLRIVDMKKQDLVLLVGEVLGKDFSSLDVSGVDIANDAEILINAMDDIYTAFIGTNKGRIRIHMLGDTPTMEAIIKVLDAMLSTDTAQVVIPWAVQNYVIPRVKSVVNTSKLDNVTDAKILSICNDSIDALYALLEMGAFSNNGIDLTNKELTDRVFNVVYNNVNLGKYQKYFDKFTRNIAVYGVLSVDYSVVSTSHEKDVAVETLRQLKALMNNYGSQIKAFDINLANDAQFEADVTNIFKQLLKSQLVSQVFMDIVNGTSKVATENHGQFAIFEGMTNEEFINVALPDIFDMVGLVADLGFRSEGGINYKDTDTIMKLVRKIVESPVTNGHLDALLSIALNKVANINIDKQVFKDADIDYNKEADYLEAFLNGIDLTNINIKDSSSFKSDKFLSEFSVAGKELLPSKVMRIVIKPVMAKAIDKVGSTNAAVAAIRKSLDDPDYSNDDAMNDYETILEIAGLVSGMGIFTGIDFDHTDNLGKAVEKLFATNIAKGNEEVLMSEILKKITFVDTSNIDLTNVSDWDYEIEQFTNMLDALTTLCKNPKFNVNDINANALNDDSVQADFVNYVEAASTTYVGSEIFKELYKTKVVPVLPLDAKDIINIDTLPNEKWAKEIEELFEIYDLVGSNGSLNASSLTTDQVLDLYDIVFGLNGKDGIESVKENRKVWLKKFINEENMLQGTTASLEWDNLDDNDQAAQEAEVKAIRDFLANVINGYVDDPENARVNDISYDNIVACKDYNKLYGTFIAMSKSVVMRGVLIGTISTGVDKNSKNASIFNLNRMLSKDFKDQVDNGYNPASWSDEQYLVLAILLASANAFDLANNNNIFEIDLGTSYADVKSYKNIPGHNANATNDFPSQELESKDERGVGFRQLLQLISLSNVFDINALAGKGGIIDDMFSFDHLRDLGTVTDWDEEIEKLTDCFVVLTKANLFNAQADVSGFLLDSNNSADALLDVLNAINNSEILRPILAEQIHNALVELIEPLVGKETANSLIKVKCEWLHNDWEYNESTKTPVKEELYDKGIYSDGFNPIVGYIKNPMSIISRN